MIVGYRTGTHLDHERRRWADDGARPLAWTAWYPVPEKTVERGLSSRFFATGRIAVDAPIADGIHPVALLSHGTGGTAESLGWIGRFLAQRGFVVVAANHHGNTGLEAYEAAGFLCWWERARDLSTLLDKHLDEGPFQGHLATEAVVAVGFSLGAYSVLKLAGARTKLGQFQAWAAQQDRPLSPREFPDLIDRFTDLRRESAVFRASLARQDRDYTDARVSKVFAIAAPPPVRAFTPDSLADMTRPVTLITGGSDKEAPTAECSEWLCQQNRRFEHEDLGRQVGHYTFLDQPASPTLINDETRALFEDHPSVDRCDVHARVQEILRARLG